MNYAMLCTIGAAIAIHCAAQAQPGGGCPAGTRLVRETSTAWHCMPMTPPRLSPGFFVTEEEVKFAREQIADYNLKKRKYQDQIVALDRVRGGLEIAAKDLNTVRRGIVLDNMVYALDVIKAGANGLLQGPARSAVNMQINLMKAEVNTIAATEADHLSERQVEKAAAVAFNLKNVVIDLSGTMAPPVADAFKRTTDTIPYMVRISERFSKPNPDKSTWELAAATTDDVLAGVGQFVDELKATRSTVHILGGEMAMWHIRQSKGSIDDAFVKSQTAKRYYLQKIAEVEQAQDFYRERIGRAQVN